YDPKKDSFHMIQPGFTVGGPVLRNRLWFFLGFAPEYDSVFRKVNFAPATLPGNSALGLQDFTRDQQTYFTTLRLDATLTQKIRDFGWPTQGVDLSFQNSGEGAVDNTGAILPAGLQLPAGATTAPFNPNFTEVNASKHYQFNQGFAFFKGGWWGTHNFKVGYQYNRLTNVIDQHGNLPFVFVFPGGGPGGASYTPSTTFGNANCATLAAGAGAGNCAGQFGFVEVQDFATVLKTPSGKVAPAIDNNHALYVQDSWTVGHGLTLDLGARVEKESLPAPSGIGISTIRTINFGWADKVEPRLGAAWGSANGKFKVFGSYGVVNDVMKLLLAQTSFGAQGFETCAYPLGPDSSGTFSPSDMSFVFGQPGRACPTGVSNVGATFAGGVTPPSLMANGVGRIENLNFRPEEPIVPGLK